MRSIDSRTGLEVIDREECLRLLAAEVVGRVAVIAGGEPAIFPVNFVLDAETIVFRSDEGTKTTSGPRARACFEIDGADRSRRAGWSVVASGWLEEVTEFDARAFERMQQLPVDPWAGGDKRHWMRLRTDHITGRRVGARA
jgi:nitroimidazol reductase NimA-like FMN-containing flavoprotein (pyridoxamine 5'-phosphate oxidase superfamily)